MELEILLGILSLFVFIFLFYVLYSGIVFERRETLEISWKGGTLKDWIDWAGGSDTRGFFTGEGAEGGPIGILIGLILDLVAFLLWLGLGALFTAIFVLSVPLFFLVQRSLRSAIARGRTCRGKVGKSLRYALMSTAMNTGWLYCILLTGHALVEFVGNQ